MNKQTMSFSSYISGKLFIALLATLLMTGVAANAQVADENPFGEAVVKHQGSIGSNDYFSVKVPNGNGEKFSIRVKDAEGNVIYTDIFSEKKFERSFQFQKQVDTSKLTFIIRSFKDNKEQVFEVNSKVFTIQQVEITKAK